MSQDVEANNANFQLRFIAMIRGIREIRGNKCDASWNLRGTFALFVVQNATAVMGQNQAMRDGSARSEEIRVHPRPK